MKKQGSFAKPNYVNPRNISEPKRGAGLVYNYGLMNSVGDTLNDPKENPFVE